MNKKNRLVSLLFTGALLASSVPSALAAQGEKSCDWEKLPPVGQRCIIEGQPFRNRGDFPSAGINIDGLASSGARFEVRTTKLDKNGKPVYTILIGE